MTKYFLREMGGSELACALLRGTFRLKIKTLLLASLSCLTGCGFLTRGVTPPPNIPPQEANVVSLDPQNWYIFYSDGVPLHPSAGSGGTWLFAFPSSQDNGHVGYIQTPFNATTTLHNVSMTFRVESDQPQYLVRDASDIPPATIHLFFEQKGDDLSNPDGRWWADAGGYNLGSQDDQTLTITVPLTWDQWTNVDGAKDQIAFSAAFANVGWIGFTCGGQYFWGHGVAMSSGSAKFILINFQVN